ncbi:MAG: DUF2442 domain-containing protein [Simkaniaceae bacterium]
MEKTLLLSRSELMCLGIKGMGFSRAKIILCKPKPNFRIWVKFEDGICGEVDLNYLVNQGVFKDAWLTQEIFNQVRIHPVTHTLTWGEGDSEVDLDPYVLREKLTAST